MAAVATIPSLWPGTRTIVLEQPVGQLEYLALGGLA